MRKAAPYRPELVAAAEAIAANLPDRREETDRLCRLPDSTMRELEEAHLFDIMKPAAYGGQEASHQTLMDCIVALSKGDGAVGWTVSLLSGGAWTLAALYNQETARDLFSSGENVRMAGAFQPKRAKVRRTSDGVMIDSGTWGFASGIRHSSWVFLGLPLFDDEGKLVGQLGGAIPVSDVQILDDWDTIGLRGTGSNSVSVFDTFVPNARLVNFSEIMAGEYAYLHLESHALYRLALLPFFSTKLSFVSLGIAKAVMDEFAESSMRRGIIHTQYDKQSEAAVTHLQIGEASAKIECAELLLRKCVQDMDHAALNGAALSLITRATIRRDASYANQLAREAIEILVNASGASSAFASHPLNRLWRDARVASLHAGINPAAALELYGRVHLGLDPGTHML
ncbi:acyl-CoA dehydrogenase family protein [Aliirhizobium terrae]|uniref:acyl-CoA dehydrogenase family protein n=1 Tax=Terrirhizobium terrae TaxID=2926709 RepID=UPI002576BD42|nr:acyl-CoA dehydrogenase family protein [Rhizobium sp. CC-CFT758]WJH41414.1 acyl-CoA dehydrogenase family protein [Rhizobium sp. CC-CFT758]